MTKKIYKLRMFDKITLFCWYFFKPFKFNRYLVKVSLIEPKVAFEEIKNRK